MELLWDFLSKPRDHIEIPESFMLISIDLDLDHVKRGRVVTILETYGLMLMIISVSSFRHGCVVRKRQIFYWTSLKVCKKDLTLGVELILSAHDSFLLGMVFIPSGDETTIFFRFFCKRDGIYTPSR